MKSAALLMMAAALFAKPAAASDFSKLSEPAFARSLLLSPERKVEIDCAGLALAKARLGRGVATSDADAMAAEVAVRLGVELDDPKEAQAVVRQSGNRFGPQPYDQPAEASERLMIMDRIAPSCATFLGAYKTGGVVGLRATLVPVMGAIPLIPLPDCVAIAEENRRLDPSSMYDDAAIRELKDLVGRGGAPAEIAARQQAIVTARKRIAEAPHDPQQLRVRGLACLATFRQHNETLGPAASAERER